MAENNLIMKFFNYLYYRMYKAYDDKNDSPLRRTFMYMSLLNFYLVTIVLFFLRKILEKIGILLNTELAIVMIPCA